VIDYINLLAPDKKIHLIHNTNCFIPDDLLLYAVDFKKQFIYVWQDSIKSLALRNHQYTEDDHSTFALESFKASDCIFPTLEGCLLCPNLRVLKLLRP
jgi:hypothetical protein